MKSTTQLESFGSMAFYGNVINVVRHNREWWRKVSRMLNKLRRRLHPWPSVDRETQLAYAYKDIVQSLKDTRLPIDVIENLKKGMEYEFHFKF
jgi:hypothetical protein